MARINETDHILIERHFDAVLTTEEKALFEQRYTTDEDFAHEVEAYRQAIEAIQIAGRTNLKANLQAHIAIKNAQKRKILRGWIVGLSAAATVLIGWFVSGNFFSKKISLDDAFQEAYRPANSGGIEKSSTVAQMTLLDSAYIAYDSHNWQNALPLFERVENPNPKTLFLKANIFLSLNEIDKAENILNRLKNNIELENRKEEIEWYLALIAMRKGNIQDLRIIADSNNHLFALRAKDLLQKVK